jgi:hypothetical protein
MKPEITQNKKRRFMMRLHRAIAVSKAGSLISDISFLVIKRRIPGDLISRRYSFIPLVATNNQIEKITIEPMYV